MHTPRALKETLTLYRESDAELRERGKRGRQGTPRKQLGEYTATHRDPVKIIDDQNKNRLSDLVPLRHARMAASPFSFFRGAAALMAFDLSHQMQTDVQVVISGDAHINNFGLYASPERRLVFDLNDFDEAAPGPWEWDVKRLLTSAVLAAEENEVPAEGIDRIVSAGALMYRSVLDKMSRTHAVERLYTSVDSTDLAAQVRDEGVKMLEAVTKKAWRRDSDRTIQHLMGPDKFGVVRFLEQPPILTKLDERLARKLGRDFQKYRGSTLPEIEYFLTQMSLTDMSRRVVGVGSVGTRCYLFALSGPAGDGLILQAKEAGESVVTKYSEPNTTTPPTLTSEMSPGQRVVTQQRILQAVSDSFLGYFESEGRGYYVRQYRDAKGSFDTTEMDEEQLYAYVVLCSLLLARAHAQSPMSSWIAGYLGGSDTFDKAMVRWARAYADQSNRDYEAFKEAIAAGRIQSDEELTGSGE